MNTKQLELTPIPQLLTGGSAVVTSLTGMPTAAACFLLPVGVVMYTIAGGIKATFLTDYVHTVMILIIIFIFAFTAYTTNANLGSPGKVYDLLVEAANRHPVDGNAQGSYLTMRSKEGAIFFVINIIGNFGTVWLDNGYYNKAISASPVQTLPGYIMGGLSWFAIPWLAATTMGLSCLALESNPVFPTYPSRMPDVDVTAGLVLPNAAVAILGKGGAAATLLLIFMAVTSASSAEYIAVSSIFTYDIYQTYYNPKASGRMLINMAHSFVVVYAIALAAFSTGLYCKTPFLPRPWTPCFIDMISLICARYWDLHGLPLPDDGGYNILGGPPGHANPNVEKTKPRSSSPLPHPRSRVRSNRLARDCPKRVRQPVSQEYRQQVRPSPKILPSISHSQND